MTSMGELNSTLLTMWFMQGFPVVAENQYRWVPLKQDFLGAWKSFQLKHYLAYPIIIISLIIQRNLATKIQAKQESGLTTVWLKQDWPEKVEIVKYLAYF